MYFRLQEYNPIKRENPKPLKKNYNRSKKIQKRKY